jgi:hypothetical protein
MPNGNSNSCFYVKKCTKKVVRLTNNWKRFYLANFEVKRDLSRAALLALIKPFDFA